MNKSRFTLIIFLNEAGSTIAFKGRRLNVKGTAFHMTISPIIKAIISDSKVATATPATAQENMLTNNRDRAMFMRFIDTCIIKEIFNPRHPH
ncbi:hypothetical protein GCM10020331_081580 [Ectobacillus funiculus]